jgi:hypothetical protein
MIEFTPAEQEQHRIELADMLIEHADEQIVGAYQTKEGVCALGAADKYILFKYSSLLRGGLESRFRFKRYFGFEPAVLIELNETPYIMYSKDLITGQMTQGVRLNKTFPEIADIVKNWKDEDDKEVY